MFMPDDIAPSTQTRLRVLDEVMEISANLMRMIQQQTQQRFEASQQACADTTKLPWPLITEDPAGAIEKLAKSIRHTVALAEQLEHPAKAPPPSEPQPPIDRLKRDIARMSDAELAQQLEIYKPTEAREREYPENYHAAEQHPNRSIADRIADICRALNLPQFPKGHPWREQFLLDLTALSAFAEEYRAITPVATAPPAPEHNATPNDDAPSTIPPDD